MKIKHPQARLAVLLLVTLSALGCSVAEEKRQLYRQSQTIAPLKIPAGMHQPEGVDMLAVPQVESLEPLDISPPVNLPEELLSKPQDTDQAN